ncbi:MAG: M3 family metallopeptidase, partial [Chloroflexi bacterium]|nr:M3 family metallopeptidase [Chloroflexota bacterium]
MFKTFPTDYTAAMDWQWSDWQPFYQHLAAISIGPGNIKQWLTEYDLLTRLFKEVEGHVEVEAMVDTTDEVAAARKKNFKQTITPEAEAFTFRLDKKLVESGLTPDALKIPLRDVQTQIRLFREENLPLKVRLSELDSEYNRISGAQTVEWDGEEITVARLRPFLQDPDRDIREKAWLAMHNRWRQDREAHNDLWREYMQVRKQMYQNADLHNYRDYAWLDRGRHDYTPGDVQQFLASILKVVVPALGRIREKLRERLGYDTLRPWDTAVDALQREPLRPFETMDVFINTTSAIFHQVDPVLGEQFDDMRDHHLLDLDNRKGKAPGGFCQTYMHTRRPYIFMNAVGLDDDVQTLLHESGHAFHGFSKLKL